MGDTSHSIPLDVQYFAFWSSLIAHQKLQTDILIWESVEGSYFQWCTTDAIEVLWEMNGVFFKQAVPAEMTTPDIEHTAVHGSTETDKFSQNR